MSAPFGNIAGQPLSIVDPAKLGRREIEALQMVATFHFRRGRAGYFARAGARITLKRAEHLVEIGLLRIDAGELVLTGSGRWTLQIANERRKEKRA